MRVLLLRGLHGLAYAVWFVFMLLSLPPIWVCCGLAVVMDWVDARICR